jgi:hypothetical protein
MLRRVFTLALAAMAVLGCSGDGSGPDDGTTRVTLLLTDAPGDIQEAVVTIEEIYLQGGEGGRVVLLDEPVTTDLLTLADSYQTLLTDVEVPAGSYSQLRFVISGAYLKVERDGGASDIFASATDYEGLPQGATVAGTLVMPSLNSSGLKVNFPGALTLEDGETTLLVDFDVAQSFGKEAGQSGKWVMHPVILGELVEEPPATP